MFMFNVPFGPPDKGGRAELSNANVHGTFFPPHTGPIGMGAKEGGVGTLEGGVPIS